MLVLALEKQDRRIDVLAILRLVDDADARRRAALDLVLQARPGSIPKITVLAVANQEQLLQLVERLADGAGARVRTEIASFALACAAVKLQARKRLVRRGIDVGVAFVVSQQHVETRFVLLDQVVLEHQRLGLGVDHRNLDAIDELHHCRSFRRRLRTREITRHALLQIARLADIEHLVLRIEHAIHARPVRQAAQE